MIKEIKAKKFGIVSAVKGNDPLKRNPITGKKYFQTSIVAEELTWKEQEKILFGQLSQEEFIKLDSFLENFMSPEYYFFTTDEKVFFTFKKAEKQSDLCKVFFHVHKLEKLVYPDIEKV